MKGVSVAELLQHFINTASAQGEDAAVLKIACANHLPEVAQALGSERWEALTPALQVLASATEPGTRAALAANLHRVGELIPEERQAVQILLPIVEVRLSSFYVDSSCFLYSTVGRIGTLYEIQISFEAYITNAMRLWC